MSKKIVVIEDEHDLAVALEESLKSKGFSVRVAGSGEDGLKLIEEDRPDVILLDSLLPGMNGLQVLEALQPIRTVQPIPVIMLSNVDNPEDLKAARQFDIAEYLVKTDWRLEDIVSKINAVH